MGITELFLVLAVLTNWWTYGELQETETKLEQSIAIANGCQEIQRESRQREIEAEKQRERSEEEYRILIAEAEHSARKFAEMDRPGCGSALLPSGVQRVEEQTRRTNTINNQWLSGPGGPDDP